MTKGPILFVTEWDDIALGTGIGTAQTKMEGDDNVIVKLDPICADDDSNSYYSIMTGMGLY